MIHKILTIFVLILLITIPVDVKAAEPNDLDVGSDVLVNVVDYQPKVVNTVSLEREDYVVYALLSGMKTNPTIRIPRIRDVNVRITEGNDYVQGTPKYFPPKSRDYTLSNMGYLAIRLKQFKTEEEVPNRIDISMTATINYDVDYGFGVNEEDHVLKELTEDQFMADTGSGAFWAGRGYIRVNKIKDGKVTFSIYDNNLREIGRTKDLRIGEKSETIYLSQGFVEGSRDLSVRERFIIDVNSIKFAQDKAKINMIINDKFKSVYLVDGQQIYPGSEWKVDDISDDGIIEKVTLVNKGLLGVVGNKEVVLTRRLKSGPTKCSDFNGDKEVCEGIYGSSCEYIDDKKDKNYNKCIDKKEEKNNGLTVNDAKIKEARDNFVDIVNIHKEWAENDVGKERGYEDAAIAYLDFMKDYPDTTYYRLAKDAIVKGVDDTEGIIPFFRRMVGEGNLEYESKIDFFYGEISKLEQINDNEFKSVVSDVLSDSRDYFEEAIRNYKIVVNSYASAKGKDNELFSYDAQARIARIYEYYLDDLEKAADAYEVLLFNFPDEVKGQEESLRTRINGLRDNTNYWTNVEEIFDDGNFLRVSLSEVQQVTGGEVAISIDGRIGKYKVGDDIPELPGYYVFKFFPSTNSVELRKNNPLGDPHKITLELGDTPSSVGGGNINVRLTGMELDEEVFITVLPGTERAYTRTDFELHIPVEKRLWSLSPEQIEDHIKGANKIIDTLNKIIDKSDGLYKIFNGACWLNFVYLWTKNLALSAEERAIRSDVVDKWDKYCASAGDKYSSKERCFDENARLMSKQIDDAKGQVNFNDPNIDPVLEVDKIITRNAINSPDLPDGLQRTYVQDYTANLRNSETIGETERELEAIRITINDKKFDSLNEEFKTRYSKQLETYKDEKATPYDRSEAYADIIEKERLRLGYVNSKEFSAKTPKMIADEIGGGTQVENDIKEFLDNNINLFEAPISTDGTIKIKKGEYSTIPFGEENKDVVAYYRNGNFNSGDVKVLYSTKTNEPISTLEDFEKRVAENEHFYYKEGEKREEVEVSNIINEKTHIKDFATESSGRYKGKLAALSVDAYTYVQIVSRDGAGAIKEIAFYRREKPNSPLAGGLRLRDPVDVDECVKEFNILKNMDTGREKKVKDGEYESDVLASDTDNNICENLRKQERSDLSQDSVNGYLKQSLLHSSGPECYKIMDPIDCRRLFGTCDPVMCPSSRFNLDGNWNVGNVIQTGIWGGIVLGWHNFDIPNEPLPVCITGINAGLKNYRAIMEGYRDCLVRQQNGEGSIGSCSYIRNIGVCEAIWSAGYTAVKAGGGKLIEKAISTDTGGGQEYSNFKANMDASQQFSSYFIGQYSQGISAAYRGDVTNEFGKEICKAAIFGKLPGQGSLIDQLSSPVAPPQFTAIVEEVVHTDIDENAESDYRVWWNIYAGEERDIKYLVYLRNSKGDTARVTYWTNLGVGEVDDIDDVVSYKKGFDEVCVKITGYPDTCGFGKVSTDFAINWAQDQYVKSQVDKRDISSEAECRPEEGIVGDTGGVISSTVELFNSGLTETGIIRKCGVNNPGLGTGQENAWAEVGTCGTDSEGRELGTCWMHSSSVELIKQKDNRNESRNLFNEFIEGFKEDSVIRDLLDLANIDLIDLEDATLRFEDILGEFYHGQEEDFNELYDLIINSYKLLIKDYEEIISSTINDTYRAEAYYKIGEINFRIGKLMTMKTSFEKRGEVVAGGEVERGIGEIGLVVIDPGHGGEDYGTIFKNSLNNIPIINWFVGDVEEKKVNLELSKKIRDEFEREKIKVILTRENNDYFIPLETRATFANQNDADLFLSVHHNSAKTNPCTAEGAETYVYCECKDDLKEDNGVCKNGCEAGSITNAVDANTLAMANCIQDSLYKTMGNSNRGIKVAEFGVFTNLDSKKNIIGVLIESGFLCNENEVKKITDKNNQKILAENIVQAVLNCGEPGQGMPLGQGTSVNAGGDETSGEECTATYEKDGKTLDIKVDNTGVSVKESTDIVPKKILPKRPETLQIQDPAWDDIIQDLEPLYEETIPDVTVVIQNIQDHAQENNEEVVTSCEVPQPEESNEPSNGKTIYLNMVGTYDVESQTISYSQDVRLSLYDNYYYLESVYSDENQQIGVAMGKNGEGSIAISINNDDGSQNSGNYAFSNNNDREQAIDLIENDNNLGDYIDNVRTLVNNLDEVANTIESQGDSNALTDYESNGYTRTKEYQFSHEYVGGIHKITMHDPSTNNDVNIEYATENDKRQILEFYSNEAFYDDLKRFIDYLDNKNTTSGASSGGTSGGLINDCSKISGSANKWLCEIGKEQSLTIGDLKIKYDKHSRLQNAYNFLIYINNRKIDCNSNWLNDYLVFSNDGRFTTCQDLGALSMAYGGQIDGNDKIKVIIDYANS